MVHAANTPSNNNMQNSESKIFTRENLYNSLTDLNTGFDAPSIKYFSETDFITIMTRCKDNQVDIYGIESFTKNGEFIDCIVKEMYIDDENNDNNLWYLEAFQDLKNKMNLIAINNNIQIIYTASYSLEN